jgi:hypothetical protein
MDAPVHSVTLGEFGEIAIPRELVTEFGGGRAVHSVAGGPSGAGWTVELVTSAGVDRLADIERRYGKYDHGEFEQIFRPHLLAVIHNTIRLSPRDLQVLEVIEGDEIDLVQVGEGADVALVVRRADLADADDLLRRLLDVLGATMLEPAGLASSGQHLAESDRAVLEALLGRVLVLNEELKDIKVNERLNLLEETLLHLGDQFRKPRFPLRVVLVFLGASGQLLTGVLGSAIYARYAVEIQRAIDEISKFVERVR